MSRLMRWTLAALVVFGLGLSPAAPSGAAQERLRLLGEYSFPSGRTFEGTTVGGLSGLAYDPQRNVYYAISDDRGELQPARFYTLEIDLGPGGISDVRIVGVTTLDSDAGAPGIQPYERNTLDAEDIVLTPSRELLISSERDQDGRPWIRRFALDGTLLGELPVPERFLPRSEPGPDGRPALVRGVRSNLGFEGLALTPDGRTLYTANEEALAQDGPIATLTAGTVIRILRYELNGGDWQPGNEEPYRTDKIFAAPNPATEFADNGVSALLAINHVWSDFDLLAMERSFSTGVGNDVVIFGVKLQTGGRTADLVRLPTPYAGPVARKSQLVRMADVGVAADNLEGMTLGPRLPSGKPSLLVLSDDNFSAFQPPQVNQLVLFELNDSAATVPPAAPAPAAVPGPAPVAQPTAAPPRPAPAQVPAALPRTGTPVVGLQLLGFGLALVGIGLRLRQRRQL